MPAEGRPVHSPDQDLRSLRTAFQFAAAFVALLWLIKLAEIGLGLSFASFGVFPGRISGLPGVLLAPMLHGSIAHLLANTSALLVLGTALRYGYPSAARVVMPVVYLGSGLAVWLFARPAYHLGASGLTFGMMFFIFTVGVLRWDTRSIALALVVFLLYGGMIWGVFPGDPAVSFESHLAGALIGIGLALLLKNRDPGPPRKRYSWEDEEESSEAWPPQEGAEPRSELAVCIQWVFAGQVDIDPGNVTRSDLLMETRRKR